MLDKVVTCACLNGGWPKAHLPNCHSSVKETNWKQRKQNDVLKIEKPLCVLSIFERVLTKVMISDGRRFVLLGSMQQSVVIAYYGSM